MLISIIKENNRYSTLFSLILHIIESVVYIIVFFEQLYYALNF